MKILLINNSDTAGGAAIAALRLVNALNESGIYARLGVKIKKTSNPYVIELPKIKPNLFQKSWKKIRNYFNIILKPITKRVTYFFKFNTTNEILHSKNYITDTDINWINNSEFDVVNLHWIIDTIGIKDIVKIKKPLVWTMHDTWPFCGAEHYPNVLENDQRFKYPYTKENKPSSTKGQDLCRKVWLKKKKYLSNKKITFLSPSNWEKECITQSSLFYNKKCYVVPNVIPKEDFKNLNDKNSLRKLLGIPSDKKILGFGAAYGINNPRSVKGTYYLLKALQQLNHKEDYFLVVFGNANEDFTSKISINYFNAGFISNNKLLAIMYNACDIFICPSLVENLSNTCLESIFCGIPVVAFNSGGTKDIIVHKETGYLATPYKTEQLVEGIEWCIQNKEMLSTNCIEKAQKDFDTKKTIEAMINVYKEILN